MKKVLFFGTFDPLHAGHRDAFFQAKSLGEYLVVVVARDSVLRTEKNREPFIREYERLATVASSSSVDEAILGDADASSYAILQKIPFDVLALGYDQKPSDSEITQLLIRLKLPLVRTVRLQPFSQNVFKSSLLRAS